MLLSRTGSERHSPLLSLSDPALYEAHISRLADRRARDRWLVPVDQVSGALDGYPAEIAARLAREVPRQGYKFAPLAPHAAVLRGKPRIIYRVDALDAVVWGAYSRALTSAIEPRLGDHLYSYRMGRSQFMAAADCVAYLQAHAAATPDPRRRGVFVLRRDVRRYDETIRVDDDSSLWTTLHGLAAGTPLGDGPLAAALMKAAFRPRVLHPDGSIAPLARGMPTGLPTQTIACNVYLLPLDREMLAIEGGFYARFGDDILYAHPELDAARHASEVLDRGVARLGLSLNETKRVDYWLTGVGRAHPSAPEATPVRKLPYLGLDVSFEGVRLRTDKRRMLLREVFQRIDRAHAQVAGASFEDRARTVTAVVRGALDEHHVLSHRYTAWLRTRAMARSDLLQLDYLIALHCAQRLTGQRGPRAFRLLSMRQLYEEHGLPSLIHAWDTARRAGRSGP